MRIVISRADLRWSLTGWMVFVLGCAHSTSKSSGELTPPVASIIPKKVDLGGVPVVDNYWWLRDKSNPAVLAYLNAENAYTDSAMKSTELLQQQLYLEMLGRIRETDESVPYKDGDWWYSRRMEKGKQYPIYLRRKGSNVAGPHVIVDVNELATGHPFFSYESSAVSDDGNLLAYSTDVTGNRQYVLQIKDLRNNFTLPDAIQIVDGFAWAADNQTLYYVKEDESKRGNRLYRHTLGKPVDSDAMLYEEKDEEFSLSLGKTRDRKFLMLESVSKTTTEVRAIPADRIAEPILIEPRKADREYHVDHGEWGFFIRVNDLSPNFRIVTAPDDKAGEKNWTEVVSARPDVMLQDIDVFQHYMIVTERREGLTQLGIVSIPWTPKGAPDDFREIPHDIPFTEPDFTVALEDNVEFDPAELRFTYTSLTTPTRVYDINIGNGEKFLMKQQFVGGGFSADNYVEERVFATAMDGTKIPISVVYRKSPAGTRPAGTRPILLEGYGAYGIPSDVYFSSTRLSLLDRGVIFATAHVRGGGEYGRAWYDAGRMDHKPNTFSDFIACAEYLQKQGYSTPAQTAIEGGSAGGLLIGAVVNQRPDLFAAALADVPWVDVLADMSDATIPLTTLEYIEWGNPNIPAQRAVIASYCPYTNVRPQAYPKMLVRESINDSQVQYWDAARWVAKLRAEKKLAGPEGKSELLLKMNMDAGHGGASGRYSELHDAAFDDAWLLTRLGIEK